MLNILQKPQIMSQRTDACLTISVCRTTPVHLQSIGRLYRKVPISATAWKLLTTTSTVLSSQVQSLFHRANGQGQWLGAV